MSYLTGQLTLTNANQKYQFPNLEGKLFSVILRGDATGNVYVGLNEDGGVNSDTGYPISTDREKTFYVTNLSKIYGVTDNAGDIICFFKIL